MKNLIEEYNYQTKNYKKWLFIKLFIANLALTGALVLTIIFYDEATIINIAFWLVASVLFALVLLTFGMIFYVSEKPMYEFLYRELLKEISAEEDIEYNYQSFPKDKEFLQKGRLFSKSHSNEVRYKLSFEAENNMVDIYNLYVYSKAQKSNRLIFNGIYMVFHVTNLSAYQIRTKGPLKNRNKNLELIEDNSKYQIFAKKDTPLPHNVTTIFNKLTKRFYDHIYISGVRNQIHIAINNFNHQHSTKSLSNNELERIKNDLESLIDLAYELNKDFN